MHYQVIYKCKSFCRCFLFISCVKMTFRTHSPVLPGPCICTSSLTGDELVAWGQDPVGIHSLHKSVLRIYHVSVSVSGIRSVALVPS
jgi:hypothetical protein